MSFLRARFWMGLGAMVVAIAAGRASDAATFALVSAAADFDRWMYPFNATPGTRPSASVFGTFGTDSGVDTRHSQFVVGWNTSNSVPVGRGRASYHVQRARLTLTINRDQAWIYDGTQDAFETYLSANDVRHRPDSDPGRPVELFGAGFRHGYTPATFPEDGPFHVGEIILTNRTVFAVGFDEEGELIDVSNNVGKLDEDAFEVRPFAVGANANLTAGELVASGSRLYFELDVTEPNIAGYLQTALNDGVLRLAVTSLEAGSFTGAATFAQFYTRDNVLAEPEDVPVLDLEVELVEETPPPQLTGIEWQADAAVLHFLAVSAGEAVLETSGDLTTWTGETISLPAGHSTWTDPSAAGTRFYRIQTP